MGAQGLWPLRQARNKSPYCGDTVFSESALCRPQAPAHCAKDTMYEKLSNLPRNPPATITEERWREGKEKWEELKFYRGVQSRSVAAISSHFRVVLIFQTEADPVGKTWHSVNGSEKFWWKEKTGRFQPHLPSIIFSIHETWVNNVRNGLLLSCDNDTSLSSPSIVSLLPPKTESWGFPHREERTARPERDRIWPGLPTEHLGRGDLGRGWKSGWC